MNIETEPNCHPKNLLHIQDEYFFVREKSIHFLSHSIQYWRDSKVL